MLYKDNPIMANDSIEYLIAAFSKNRAEIDNLKILETELREQICNYMGKHDSVVDKNGQVIAKWTYKNPAQLFDRAEFKKAYPLLDKQFTKPGEAVRAFSVLVKVV